MRYVNQQVFATLRQLAKHANALGLTLHTAFDLVSDYRAAIDLAPELSFERILTSGGAKQAINGLARLMDCVSHTAGRIKIMPAGGIDPESATTLLENLPIEEIHAWCSSEVTAGDPKLVELGFSAAETKSTDRAKIEALRQVLRLRSRSTNSNRST